MNHSQPIEPSLTRKQNESLVDFAIRVTDYYLHCEDDLERARR